MFNVGDKVRLLKCAVAGLVVGRVYTVESIHDKWFHVAGPEGMTRFGDKSRLSPDCWELAELRTMKDVAVGDKVFRVNRAFNAMAIDAVGTVTEIHHYGDGTPCSVRLDEFGNGHDINNLRLVDPHDPPQPQAVEEIKMPYEFKVGDTGKTRDGRAYRVVAVDVATETGRCVIALARQNQPDGQETVVRTRLDGRVYVDDNEAGADLLPPKIKVYQIACAHRTQALAVGEIAADNVLITVYKNKAAADMREKELKGYYKEVIVTELERDQ